jgi:ABC-2 type transport system permease protein
MKLFLHQLYLELLKLFTRKRTYLGFATFLAVEILILTLLQLPAPQRAFARLLDQNGYGFELYFSGLTLAFLMMSNTIFFLGSLYLALISGDMVAKEVEDGTLRMVLCRPVSRLRVLFIKYLACMIYTGSLMIFIVVTSLLGGIAYKGVGSLFVYAPLEDVFGLYDAGPALARYALATVALWAGTLTIATLGFMFSCFNMKPAAATIVTLSIFFIDMVVRLIPYFQSIKGYLLTYHMAAWIQIFQPYIPWWRLAESMIYLMAFNATFLLIACVHFCRRDFKS